MDIIDEDTSLIENDRDVNDRPMPILITRIASAFILLAALCGSAFYQLSVKPHSEFGSNEELDFPEDSEVAALEWTHHGNDHECVRDCLHDKKYSSHTMKTAYELPFAALFSNTRGERKFEASSVIQVDGDYYAICDNSWAISKFSIDLTPFSSKNMMIGDPNREEYDSGYEAIFYHNATFYVMRESILHNESAYHAIIEELELNDEGNDYIIKEQCSCEFEFEGGSKGFEGASGFEGTDGEFYVIGLCEGNHCSETRKGHKGNGQMILMKKDNCIWKTIKTINIPKTADFTDYSDISIRPDGKVALTTQEDSAVWIGQLLGVTDGMLDPNAVEFDNEVHKVYSFPKSNICQTVYCNIEGVEFINDDMLMFVSDKMKKHGKQPFQCLEKDQSIHAFILP